MIEGFVESIRTYQVRGWAFAPSYPSELVVVSLFVDGVEIGNAPARLYREDLEAAGKGDGRHGFVINLDQQIPTRDLTRVWVSGRVFAERQNLPFTEGLVIEHTVSESGNSLPPSAMKGYVQAVSPNTLVGWAFDQGAPEATISVRALASDGSVVGAGEANAFRRDLVVALGTHGLHGFEIRLAKPLVASEVTVEAVSSTGVKGQLSWIDNTAAPAGPTARKGPRMYYPLESSDVTHHPIFILGAARSGTSAIAQALMRCTKYKGHEEGHLLDLLAPMQQAIRRHFEDRAEEWQERSGTMIAQVSDRFIDEGVRNLFIQVARGLFPEGKWLDKTPRPSMIAIAPLLREIWPNAKFIFMKRRAIENIVSRRKKFPNLSFEDHCRDWLQVMNTWLAVRSSLVGAALEIDQLWLATYPEQVARTLERHLNLSPSETERVAESLAVDRPERTADRFAQVHSLDSLDWKDEEREHFGHLCTPVMAEFGYGLGHDYFLNGGEHMAMVDL